MPTSEPQRRKDAEGRRADVVGPHPTGDNLRSLSAQSHRSASSLAARVVLVTTVLALAACAAPAPKPVKPLANLSGTVTYQEPITLSPDTVVTVQLADVSRQDVPAKVLAEQVISSPGRSPIPFDLSYDPDAIVPSHTYAVQARVEWEGRLLFVTDTRHCAITRGCPTKLDVPVVPVRK
jgi:putative lipoprotein